MKLIPMPKKVQYLDGVCCLDTLCVPFVPSALPDAVKMSLQAYDHGGSVPFKVTCGESASDEAYRLHIDPQQVYIEADGYRGVFYALQTLKQLQKDGEIVCAHIEDAPDLTYRGLYQDVSRGRIPTVETVKKLIDRMSELKLNSLQLYIEHTHRFQEYVGIHDDLGYYTDEEILELDRYCRDRCVELIPSLSSFGHLYYLLSSERYRYLCEIPDYQPTQHQWHERLLHHTIDPSNPESEALITSLIAQYEPLFTSKYFNICCDETFDLCKGRNAGGDVAQSYAGFVKKLVSFLQERGKTVMMWADIVMKHPETLDILPDGIIYLNWDYDANANGLRAPFLKEHGVPQIVCPSVHSHKRLLEKIEYSVPNIEKVIDLGFKNEAYGVLITNWGDYGHLCPDEGMLFGLSFGAAKAWNVSQTSLENIEQAILSTVYHTSSREVVDTIRSLNACDELFLESFGYEKALWELTVQYFDNERGIPPYFERHRDDLQKLDLVSLRETCLTCAERLERLLQNNDLDERIGEALLLAARGNALIIGMLNDACHGRTYSDALLNERAAWLSDQKALWDRRNKPGEWREIERFFTMNMQRETLLH